MDNPAGRPHDGQATQRGLAADKLQRAINATFWDPEKKRVLVSTQLEQKTQQEAFYPDKVAQIFPMVMDFPVPGGDSRAYYRNWMKMHRAEWLRQGDADYPWGVLAVLAIGNAAQAHPRCWLRATFPPRPRPRGAGNDTPA